MSGVGEATRRCCGVTYRDEHRNDCPAHGVAPAHDPALAAATEDCHRCGGPNVVWFAPSPLWNKVMRGDDINGDPLYGDLVCVTCFVILAERQGVKPTRWRLTADPEPEGLIYETPSGRVWDPERWRWVEADEMTPNQKVARIITRDGWR